MSLETLFLNCAGRFSRNDTTPSLTSSERPRAVDAAAVDLMGFHRVVGAQHAPHHLADQGHRHRRGLGGDLLGERARAVGSRSSGGTTLLTRRARERFLRRKHPAGV